MPLKIILALYVPSRFGTREGFVSPLPPEPVYGHVHVAKTGGTSINGMLANQFERVCGNKGYSYDFFRSNRRHKTGRIGGAKDFVHDHWKAWLADRQKVPFPIMNEIGYEDCDWISLEDTWRVWGSRHGVTELHVPCREPVEHLLSMCNHMSRSLDNTSRESLLRSARRCYIGLDRFSYKLLAEYRVKCFSFEHQFNATKGYLRWISSRLQRKRQYEPYNRVSTNRKRKQLHLTDDEKQVLTTELMRHDYYRFCRDCMQSYDVLQ